MAHFRRLVVSAFAFGAFLTSCTESVGPGIKGRWAASGIELISQPGTTELRLLCFKPAQLPDGLHPDSASTIRFSVMTEPLELAAPYRVDFEGQFVGDALFATVTRTSHGGSSSVQTYTMLPNGDPQFDRFACAL